MTQSVAHRLREDGAMLAAIGGQRAGLPVMAEEENRSDRETYRR
jgi:hypothetical protein